MSEYICWRSGFKSCWECSPGRGWVINVFKCWTLSRNCSREQSLSNHGNHGQRCSTKHTEWDALKFCLCLTSPWKCVWKWHHQPQEWWCLWSQWSSGDDQRVEALHTWVRFPRRTFLLVTWFQFGTNVMWIVSFDVTLTKCFAAGL